MTEAETERLRRLLAREEIRDACLRYTRGVDRHDDDIAVAAYHPGALDDHGTFIGDAEELIRHAGTLHADNWETHQHYITNQTMEVDGDSAHAETYFIAVLKRKDATVDIVGGRYIDRFEQRDGRWAIIRRVSVVEWNGELVRPRAPMDGGLFIGGVWDRTDASYDRPLEVTRAHRDLRFVREESTERIAADRKSDRRTVR